MAVSNFIETMFNNIDVDKDGTITKNEMDNLFKILDADGSGTISVDEWSTVFVAKFQGTADQAQKAFGKICQNNEITTSNFQQMFQAMDLDGNGSVSKDEFFSYWTQLLS